MMFHVIPYIQSGNGRGLRGTLLLALLIGIVTGAFLFFTMRFFWRDEAVQKQVQTLPPLTFESGVLTEPKDFRWSFSHPGGPFAIEIDTTRDAFGETPAQDGFYIARRALLFNSGGHRKELAFPAESVIVTPALLDALAHRLLILSAVLSAALMFAFVWIGFGLLYALIPILLHIFQRPRPLPLVGRAICVSWTDTLILNMILVAVGHGLSAVALLTTAGILTLFILFYLAPQE